ncbi:MAG: hypothetical protein LBD88_03205 [Candidatus Peribacteria bacterium]|jgi:hypothetical protein|nr:hypothetical protein [Candidatus Peribacteria bacterium]
MRKLLFTGILLFLTTTYTFSFCEVQKTELEYREKEYTKAEREYLELYERL